MMNTRRFVVAVCLSVAIPSAAAGATFTVNSTGNNADAAVGNGVCATPQGECTLRAAIQEANVTAAPDNIYFAIGSGAKTIAVPSGLPTITQPVVIDGSTQPGFAGAPLIELDGTLFSGTGLELAGGLSTVRSLIVSGFGGDGIRLFSKGGDIIEGCYVGTTADGTGIKRNLSAGIRVETYSNRIGGPAPAQRNIISGNGGLFIEGGILIVGSQALGNIVQGNYIGLDVTGMLPLGNLGRGVAIQAASYNLIGGPTKAEGNLIAGNRASGVRMMSGSIGNVVWNNRIGVNNLNATNVGEYPQPGILSNARGVQIRGDGNYVKENLIAGNTWDGVLFYDGTGQDLIPMGFPSGNQVEGNYIYQNGYSGIGVYVGEKNRLTRNAIFGNGHLGINLEDRTFGMVTLNDPDDSDTGTNGFQNFPVVTSAAIGTNQTTIAGTLASRPSRLYTVELFVNLACGAFGYGQGLAPLGTTSVTTDAAGAGSFTFVLPKALVSGMVVTATATDPDGNTSEFSACTAAR
jgi:CSLREA domain-containing protein